MEKHQTEFKEAIENTPIIPAIKMQKAWNSA